MIESLIAIAIVIGAPSSGESKDTPTKGRYADVSGLRMYYEIHGTGAPLVLLHGWFSTIDTDFGKIIPAFAKTRQVIAIEQQAHGHTADINRQFSYEQMADDTAALLRQLKIEQADFVGYSMGGAIALQMARRYPALVRKFVFAGGTSYAPDGLYPELREGLKRMKPEDMNGSPWQKAYASVAPNPENWAALVSKKQAMDLRFAGWSQDDVKTIEAPSLLIIGDADIVRPEHTVEMFRLLGGGVVGDLHGLPRAQLAVLPGTTHVTFIDRTEWLVSMISSFLDAPAPTGKGAGR
jgi:pimeloyl-ACP methyl ester carboxylesterase